MDIERQLRDVSFNIFGPILNRLDESLNQLSTLDELRLDMHFESSHDYHAFKQLIMQTGHLKRLIIRKRKTYGYGRGREGVVMLSDLAQYLTQLQELDINQDIFYQKSPEKLLDLRLLKALQVFKLCGLDEVDEAHLNAILDNVSEFQHLTTLTLEGTRYSFPKTINQQSVVNIAAKLKELQLFSTHNFKWTSDAVIEFIRLASKLESITVKNKVAEVTPDFVREAAKARESVNHQKRLSIHFGALRPPLSPKRNRYFNFCGDCPSSTGPNEENNMLGTLEYITKRAKASQEWISIMEVFEEPHVKRFLTFSNLD